MKTASYLGTLTSVAICATISVASGCVSNGTMNKKVAELNGLRDADNAAAKKREADLAAQLDDTKKQLDHETAVAADLQTQLDQQTTLVAALQDKLKSMGANVDSLTKANTDAAARLEELKKAKAAADARLAAFRTLITKLHSMIDSGQLKVVIREGRMIIALPSDILFESGSTDVKGAGKTALANVAKVLATVPDRNFIVAGHTDDVPIKTAVFPSNWELSTRRAVEVVHLLVKDGMNAKTLAAGGYGEFDPVAPNDSNEHRAQNRRIEIVLQPNISDLPNMDELTQDKGK